MEELIEGIEFASEFTIFAGILIAGVTILAVIVWGILIMIKYLHDMYGNVGIVAGVLLLAVALVVIGMTVLNLLNWKYDR